MNPGVITIVGGGVVGIILLLLKSKIKTKVLPPVGLKPSTAGRVKTSQVNVPA